MLCYPFPSGITALSNLAVGLVLCEGARGLRDPLAGQWVGQRVPPGPPGSIPWMQLWFRAGSWHGCWTGGTGKAAGRWGRAFGFETAHAKAASACVCLLYARLCLGLWAPRTSLPFAPQGCVSPSPTLTVPSTVWGRVPRLPELCCPRKVIALQSRDLQGELLEVCALIPGLGSWGGLGGCLSEGPVCRAGWVPSVGSAQTVTQCLAEAPAPSCLFIIPFRQFTKPVPSLAGFRDLEKKLPAVVWLQDSL